MNKTFEAMKTEANRVSALVRSFIAAGDIEVWQHADIPAEWRICLNDVAFDHTNWDVCPTSLSGTLAELIREQLRDLDNLPGLVWRALKEAFTRIEGVMVCTSEDLFRAFEHLTNSPDGTSDLAPRMLKMATDMQALAADMWDSELPAYLIRQIESAAVDIEMAAKTKA